MTWLVGGAAGVAVLLAGLAALARTPEARLGRRLRPSPPRRRRAWPWPRWDRDAAEALPSLLLDLAASLRTGLDLALALRGCAGESNLGKRVRAAMDSYDLGLPIGQTVTLAFAGLGPDGRAAERVLQVHLEAGGRLAPMLVQLARSLEARRLLRGEVAARSAEARYSALLLAALPPLLFTGLWHWAPSMAAPLLHTSIGRLALGGALLLWLGGAACCAWLIRAAGGRPLWTLGGRPT